MPAITLHPPAADRSVNSNEADQVLPQLLQTPSGLALLEIQGTVNTPVSSAAGPSPIGNLVFPQYDAETAANDASWQKRVHLYVGKHQRLTGEVKKLAKPIAVIRRRQSGTATTETLTDANDDLEITEIIYYKVLFGSRPEPVGGG